jgi:hypothetical protein
MGASPFCAHTGWYQPARTGRYRLRCAVLSRPYVLASIYIGLPEHCQIISALMAQSVDLDMKHTYMSRKKSLQKVQYQARQGHRKAIMHM